MPLASVMQVAWGSTDFAPLQVHGEAGPVQQAKVKLKGQAEPTGQAQQEGAHAVSIAHHEFIN